MARILWNYIDGLLLSDGHIQENINKTSGRYIQRCKYKEWLDDISNFFFNYGIINKVSDPIYHKGFSKDKLFVVYSLFTHRYLEFKNMRDRWYKPFYYEDREGYECFKYKKCIPKDIDLTPCCVANWYIGDGNISKHYIGLATNDFLREDTIFLSELLSKTLDIKCTATKENRIIISRKSGIEAFLDYIKEYKISCYSYKFPEGAI